MSNTEGLKYTPLFHSEISSSYLLQYLFDNHKELVIPFLNEFLELNLSFEKVSEVSIEREHFYFDQGSIDLFIRFKDNGHETHVLIEVKVHDYKSAKKGQIERYYDADTITLDEKGKTYFIYLTQFNDKNRPTTDDISTPPTIEVFEASKARLRNKNLRHVNWEEFHKFLEQFLKTLSVEEKTMVSLQKKWVLAQSIKDLSENTNTVGQRPLSDYFEDITTDIQIALPFGKKKSLSNRLIYTIPLLDLEKEHLDKIIQIIEEFSNSNSVNSSKRYQTEPETLSNVKMFLTNLAQNEKSWLLLYFYTSLLVLIGKTGHLKLNGTGISGLSIKLRINGKGEISLCTLWLKENKIEFALLR
jgi:hypothetical protein